MAFFPPRLLVARGSIGSVGCALGSRLWLRVDRVVLPGGGAVAGGSLGAALAWRLGGRAVDDSFAIW